MFLPLPTVQIYYSIESVISPAPHTHRLFKSEIGIVHYKFGGLPTAKQFDSSLAGHSPLPQIHHYVTHNFHNSLSSFDDETKLLEDEIWNCKIAEKYI